MEMVLAGKTRGDALGFTRLHVSSQIWSVGLLCLLAGDVFGGGSSWSSWFSTLDVTGNDNQTWITVKDSVEGACPADDVLDVQCRTRNSSSIVITSGAATVVSCNLSSLCTDLLKSLPLLLTCPDVELRVKCPATDTTDPQPTTDQPLKVNGGFIAMAAGLSVIIPLICVLIIQLRRSKREERERAATAAAAAAASAAESGLPAGNDLPPSYEQLFGTSVNPVTSEPLHSRQSSLDLLIETNETSRVVEASRTRAVSSNGNIEMSAQITNVHLANTADVSPGEQTSDGGYVNHGYSSTSVSTISGSEVFYYPLSTSFSQDNPESSSRLSLQLIHTRASDFVDAAIESSETAAVTTTSSDDMSSVTSSQMSSMTSGHSSLSSVQSSSLSSDSTPSLSSVSTSTSSEGSDTHQGSSPTQLPPSSTPPPPPYTSPAVSRHNTNNNSTASTTSGQSTIQQMLRRFPGMHISFQDILSSFRAPQDTTENEVPPPSYEEALKILECAKLSSQTILGKTD